MNPKKGNLKSYTSVKTRNAVQPCTRCHKENPLTKTWIEKPRYVTEGSKYFFEGGVPVLKIKSPVS